MNPNSGGKQFLRLPKQKSFITMTTTNHQDSLVTSPISDANNLPRPFENDPRPSDEEIERLFTKGEFEETNRSSYSNI